MANIADPKLTQDEFDRLSSPLVLDLYATFNIAEDQIIKMLDTAKKEGWTGDQLITEIGRLFDEPTDTNQRMFDNSLEEN